MSEQTQDPAVIEFTDSDGVRWEVREIPAPVLDTGSAASAFGDFSRGWLLFSSEHLKKRLTNYPEEWRTLSPYELEKWCWRARPGRKLGNPTGQTPAYGVAKIPEPHQPGSG